MTLAEVKEKIGQLMKDYRFYAPYKNDGRLVTGYVASMDEVDLSAVIPDYSFKEAFFPSRQILFHYKKGKMIRFQEKCKSQIILGMSLPDLQALELYTKVFTNDYYFKCLINKTVVVGIAHEPVAKDYLETLPFDLLLIIKEGNKYEVAHRTHVGKKIALELGFSEAQKIKEKKFIPFKKFTFFKKIKEILLQDKAKKVFEDLGKRCIECGKCTLVCPTCFCFRLDDEPSLKDQEGLRVRTWDACFYHEFSEVAGNHRFLETTRERIKFWYYHKFVRIPDEYNLLGCVSCGRCSRTCPAKISLPNNLEAIYKTAAK